MKEQSCGIFEIFEIVKYLTEQSSVKVTKIITFTSKLRKVKELLKNIKKLKLIFYVIII